MKVVFEHQGRKTTILGNDYDTIINKIRSLFPEQSHQRIQFYDPELTDYFEFTSYEQIIDQPNGLKMNFDTLAMSAPLIVDPLSQSTPLLSSSSQSASLSSSSSSSSSSPSLSSSNLLEKRLVRQVKNAGHTSSKRDRKKQLLIHNCESIAPPTLPVYCDAIIQGLQSRESFPAIQQEFLRQTSTYFIEQYPDNVSRKTHHAFVIALTQKFPILNYLDKNVDGTNGRSPYHTISSLLSRKKRNIKYSKNHPTSKRPRLDPNAASSNDGTDGNVVVETTIEEATHQQVLEYDQNDLLNETLLEQLLNESNIIETLPSLPEPTETSALATSTSETPNQPQIVVNNNKRATISLVIPSTEKNTLCQLTSSSSNNQLPSSILSSQVIPSISSSRLTPSISSSQLTSTPSFINNSSNSTSQLMVRPIIAANAPTNLVYYNGRMHTNSFPLQSVVAVHKAIVPRACEKKKGNKENNNCTSTNVLNEEPRNVLTESTSNNINPPANTKSDTHICFSKLSKSQRSAYDKDINRLRSILKSKKRSTTNVSISEIHILIHNTHAYRRQFLLENDSDDFYTKVLKYQEIFNEEALIAEYTELNNKILSFEDIQYEARKLLDDLNTKYNIAPTQKTSETDFLSMKVLCEEINQHYLFFKNGLSNPQPMIGILFGSSSTNDFERACLFVRNLPYKMVLSITNGGLHRLLAIIVIIYINLNAQPDHLVLQILLEQCKKKETISP